jgi:hypothetical protein
VVEVAKELIEAVVARQHLIAVAEVVLAELTGHVTVGLEQAGDGRVFLLHAFRRSRQPDLCQTGTHGRLAGDERSPAGGAALLAVPVGKDRSFGGNTVDVRRLVAHHSHVVGGDIELADVVSPDHQDVRFVLRRRGTGKHNCHQGDNCDSHSIRSHISLLFSSVS